MVSIALLLFRPNPDFVLLLPIVEPERGYKFNFFAARTALFPMARPIPSARPFLAAFAKFPPPALRLSGSGFFASF
jgi:hypothetical protein